MRRLGMLAIVAAVLPGTAGAHAPATAIGQAVEALRQVSVSYGPGSVVSDVEAGGFPAIVGDDVRVAFMPAAAADEIVGGPNAVASEVAREAGIDGTLVVLVGNALGAWSDDIGDDRLAELVDASAARQGGSPAAAVESLVRSVQAEPRGSDLPWGWIAVAMLLVAAGALIALDRAVRRRP